MESKSDLDDKQLYDEISAMIIERAESKGGPEIGEMLVCECCSFNISYYPVREI